MVLYRKKSKKQVIQSFCYRSFIQYKEIKLKNYIFSDKCLICVYKKLHFVQKNFPLQKLLLYLSYCYIIMIFTLVHNIKANYWIHEPQFNSSTASILSMPQTVNVVFPYSSSPVFWLIQKLFEVVNLRMTARSRENSKTSISDLGISLIYWCRVPEPGRFDKDCQVSLSLKQHFTIQ